MTSLSIDKKTILPDLVKKFLKKFGAVMLVFTADGHLIASDDYLVKVYGAKTGKISFRSSLTVGSFVERFYEKFGLKAKILVFDNENHIKAEVNEYVPLGKIEKIKKKFVEANKNIKFILQPEVAPQPKASRTSKTTSQPIATRAPKTVRPKNVEEEVARLLGSSKDLKKYKDAVFFDIEMFAPEWKVTTKETSKRYDYLRGCACGCSTIRLYQEEGFTMVIAGGDTEDVVMDVVPEECDYMLERCENPVDVVIASKISVYGKRKLEVDLCNQLIGFALSRYFGADIGERYDWSYKDKKVDFCAVFRVKNSDYGWDDLFVIDPTECCDWLVCLCFGNDDKDRDKDSEALYKVFDMYQKQKYDVNPWSRTQNLMIDLEDTTIIKNADKKALKKIQATGDTCYFARFSDTTVYDLPCCLTKYEGVEVLSNKKMKKLEVSKCQIVGYDSTFNKERIERALGSAMEFVDIIEPFEKGSDMDNILEFLEPAESNANVLLRVSVGGKKKIILVMNEDGPHKCTLDSKSFDKMFAKYKGDPSGLQDVDFRKLIHR